MEKLGQLGEISLTMLMLMLVIYERIHVCLKKLSDLILYEAFCLGFKISCQYFPMKSDSQSEKQFSRNHNRIKSIPSTSKICFYLHFRKVLE
jgi:hypothetical protein